MVVYNIYIFDNHGTFLFYSEYKRVKKAEMSHSEEGKLMYGLLYSLKSMCQKLSSNDSSAFNCYRTNKYKLNYMETPSGLWFALNTDVNANGVKELLQSLYQQVYVEFVVKNPECERGKPIESALFKHEVDEFIRRSPQFR
ncbi:trafficking protein particle complex subunit 1-like [Tropilaelaps mercedesae]|uniref:Trafficking protein particle complex subunit n=1 Tax=Tropilaelaps mercedesae TaxID=418985 RepID=A0A1V9XD65_9ACAR|nr:trafficking protein particle complex subunit 1-like [Tropilaelaps mercedesae]